MSDIHEVPTKRLTATWKGNELRAEELAERLSAAARAEEADVLRSRRLRGYSDTAKDFARVFSRWSLKSVPTEQKDEELNEFESFIVYVDRMLARRAPREPT